MFHSRYARWFLLLLAGVLLVGGAFAYLVKDHIKETATGKPGTLMGQVTIGPNCPVESTATPCVTSPDAFRSRQVVVYAPTVLKKEIARVPLSPFGGYTVQLPPGQYTVDIEGSPADSSKDLPKQVTIVSDQITEFNFSIDTGIR
jgi:hypothetical protein